MVADEHHESFILTKIIPQNVFCHFYQISEHPVDIGMHKPCHIKPKIIKRP